MNIELAVVAVYHEYPDLLDFQVDEGLGALISRYTAEEQGKSITPPRVRGLARDVYEAVSVSSELMLGRPEKVMDTIPVATLLPCLLRIRKSVRFWTKKGGGRGYLKYVQNFLRG